MARAGAGGMSGGILNRDRTRLRGRFQLGPKNTLLGNSPALYGSECPIPRGSMDDCQALAEGIQTPYRELGLSG